MGLKCKCNMCFVFWPYGYTTLSSQFFVQATVTAVEKAVSRICKLSHDLIPILGCKKLLAFTYGSKFLISSLDN